MSTETVPVWAVGLYLVVALVVAWGLSVVARWLLRGRARLSPSASIIICMLGMSIGLMITGWLGPSLSLWGVVPIAVALLLSVAGIAGGPCSRSVGAL